MNISIGPELSIGDLRIGTPRIQARALLGTAVTFRRTPDAPETDHFAADGLLLTYEGDRVTFIEVVAPASPTILGVELLGVPLPHALGELARVGVVGHLDADGAFLPEWHVGLYSPEGVVEGVSIGE